MSRIQRKQSILGSDGGGITLLMRFYWVGFSFVFLMGLVYNIGFSSSLNIEIFILFDFYDHLKSAIFSAFSFISLVVLLLFINSIVLSNKPLPNINSKILDIIMIIGVLLLLTYMLYLVFILYKSIILSKEHEFSIILTFLLLFAVTIFLYIREEYFNNIKIYKGAVLFSMKLCILMGLMAIVILVFSFLLGARSVIVHKIKGVPSLTLIKIDNVKTYNILKKTNNFEIIKIFNNGVLFKYDKNSLVYESDDKKKIIKFVSKE